MARENLNSTSQFNTSRMGSDTATAGSSLTVAAVRQTRVRIESDVVKMHNRIHLLQQEEDRALKMIQATR